MAGLALILLIAVIILAYKVNSYRKGGYWKHQGANGHGCGLKKTEPFLLDGDGEDLPVPLDSYPYDKNDVRERLAMSNL